jgi:hypothetical protein
MGILLLRKLEVTAARTQRYGGFTWRIRAASDDSFCIPSPRQTASFEAAAPGRDR